MSIYQFHYNQDYRGHTWDKFVLIRDKDGNTPSSSDDDTSGDDTSGDDVEVDESIQGTITIPPEGDFLCLMEFFGYGDGKISVQIPLGEEFVGWDDELILLQAYSDFAESLPFVSTGMNSAYKLEGYRPDPLPNVKFQQLRGFECDVDTFVSVLCIIRDGDIIEYIV